LYRTAAAGGAAEPQPAAAIGPARVDRRLAEKFAQDHPTCQGQGRGCSGHCRAKPEPAVSKEALVQSGWLVFKGRIRKLRWRARAPKSDRAAARLPRSVGGAAVRRRSRQKGGHAVGNPFELGAGRRPIGQMTAAVRLAQDIIASSGTARKPAPTMLAANTG